MFKEMSFISYYFHWPQAEVLGLDHNTRRRWCREISFINQNLSLSDGKGKEKSITEINFNPTF